MKFWVTGRPARSATAVPRAEAWLSSGATRQRSRSATGPGVVPNRCGNADLRNHPRKLTTLLAGVLPQRQSGRRDKRRQQSRSASFCRAAFFACGSKRFPASPSCSPLTDGYIDTADAKSAATTRFDFANVGERRSHSPPDGCSPYGATISPREHEALACFLARSQKTVASLRKGRSHSASRQVADRFRSRRLGRALSELSVPARRDALNLDGCDSLMEELERAWMELEDHHSRCLKVTESSCVQQDDSITLLVEPSPRHVPSPASLLGSSPGLGAGSAARKAFADSGTAVPLHRQRGLQRTPRSVPTCEHTCPSRCCSIEHRTACQPLPSEQNASSKLVQQLKGGRTTIGCGSAPALGQLMHHSVSPMSMSSRPTAPQTPRGYSFTQTCSSASTMAVFTTPSESPASTDTIGSAGFIGTTGNAGTLRSRTTPHFSSTCSEVGTGRLHEAQALLSEMFTPSVSSSTSRTCRKHRRHGSAPHVPSVACSSRPQGSATLLGTAQGRDASMEEHVLSHDSGHWTRGRRSMSQQPPQVHNGLVCTAAHTRSPIDCSLRGRGAELQAEYGRSESRGAGSVSRSGSIHLKPLNGSMPWFPAGDSPPKQQSSTPESSRHSAPLLEESVASISDDGALERPREVPAISKQQHVPRHSLPSPQLGDHGGDSQFIPEGTSVSGPRNGLFLPLNTQDADFCNLLAAALATPPVVHEAPRISTDLVSEAALDHSLPHGSEQDCVVGSPVSLGLSPSILAYSRDRDSVTGSDVVQSFHADEDESWTNVARSACASPGHPEVFLLTPMAASVDAIASPLECLEVLDV